MKNWHSKADISFYDNIWEHEFFHIIQGCTRLSVFWSHQENQQYIVQGWDIFLNKASELKINITVKCIMESSLWWPLIVWLHLYDSFFCENLPTIASPSHLIGPKSSDLRSTFFSWLLINPFTIFFAVIGAVISGDEQIHLLSKHYDALSHHRTTYS